MCVEGEGGIFMEVSVILFNNCFLSQGFVMVNSKHRIVIDSLFSVFCPLDIHYSPSNGQDVPSPFHTLFIIKLSGSTEE
jgi:hypothetical protein